MALRGTWAPWLPALFMLPALALPFVLGLVIPALAGEPLERSDFAAQIESQNAVWPEVARLDRRAAVQAFLFQQFFVLVILVPVSGAMSIAAHSIIGEKEARALEPLLATPLTAIELLLAKVLAAFLPALLLEAAALVVYFGGIAAAADPGVLGVLLSGHTLTMAGLVGPLASLVALQLVVLTSTRAKDPRSAQQIGVLIVLPIVGVMLAQGAGSFWLTGGTALLVSLGLFALWVALLAVSAAAFDGERILTRWR
jgi:ABC-2 type transport system permease protein